VADAGASAIGMIGLGRMGGNMAKRMKNAGLTVVGYDRSSPERDVTSLEELVKALPQPRVVWVMVPAGDPTAETVEALGKLLDEGDVVVDGGNSRYTDDQRHSDHLAERGVGFVDCGVSGWGVGSGVRLRADGGRLRREHRQGAAVLRCPQAGG